MTKANKMVTITSKSTPSQTKTPSKKARVLKDGFIKYADKSAGQPELITIFLSIKALMKPFATGTIKERGEKEGIYNLVSEKQIEAGGNKKNEVYFASILI
jgi:hypothetical protein